MADFHQLRNDLNNARSQKEQSRLALFKEKERLSKIQREKDALGRIFDKSNKLHIRRLRELESAENGAKAQIEEWSAELQGNIKNEFGIFQKFTPFTDPREHLGMLNDSYPILLMPVRIETRFKKIRVENAERNQLWVRIFPDECAIDTFESVPSETEMENTRFYWSALWQAGGQEDFERAAWRTLVSSHGSGRAAWLIKNYMPENPGDQPKKLNPNDHFLVISAIDLPPEADRLPILDFWKAYWKADGDTTLQNKAYQIFAAAVTETTANQYIESYKPDNLDQPPQAPTTHADANVSVVFLDFPIINEIDTKKQSWSQAPKTTVLPDRFVLIGYQNDTVAFERVGNAIPSPLIMGPDPGLEKEEQIKQENGEIIVNEDIRWMVDFDEAIQKGLGFKIDLNTTQASRGFSKIIALGVKLSADEQKGTAQLEELIEHHKSSRKGFSILPQGTPTNNTEKEGSGYRSLDDADLSFDNLRKEKLFDLTTDWKAKKDGQWLAESLGISDNVIQNVMYSDGTDQCEARAMNTALWPATMGYMMDTLMQPIFSENDVESTREFFNHLVVGRGTVPAVKIGKQPYGIMPTTAFSKIAWTKKRSRVPTTPLPQRGKASVFTNYLDRIYTVLKKIDADWTKDHLAKVGFVGKQGDAHQILLDVLALNPDSVEFHQRYAESFEQLKNRLSFFDPLGDFKAFLMALGYIISGENLLSKFGVSTEETVDILMKFFFKSQNLLKGPLIDDVPLSEILPIRNYTPAPDERNYIKWLIDAASTSHNTLRRQEGFNDGKIPSAMLYLMLHHALDLNFVEVSLKMHLQAELISNNQLQLARQEPAYIHVAENVKQSESKWQYLYKKESKITGNQHLEIGDYIPKVMKTHVATAYLKEQLEALEHLQNASTASLERAFVEHIDLCTYRLDGWKNGIMNYELAMMRQASVNADGEEESIYKQGVYLGAYGILEDVKSENKNLTEIRRLDEDIKDTFLDPDHPLYKDDKNGGYVAAPSLNHAVTAAVLRNGYMENASQANPDLLSVNLSSERVRKALGAIEGIRGGQSLAELLGYQLERGLHDGYPGLELDVYIYELRRAFPLRANKHKDTRTPANTPIEEIEARNVVDGLMLINHLKTQPSNAVYPYGKPLSTDGLTAPMINAIKAEVNKIQDLNDAVSDVAIAESVHQVVQGNYDRGAATLNTYSKGNFPPIPDVVQTPRSGVNLTHRFGLQLESGLNPMTSPTTFPMTPRAKGEPALNKLITGLLPDPSNVACKVVYFDYTSKSEKEGEVNQNMLKIHGIDLLYTLNIDMEQAMAQIDDLVLQYVRTTFSVRPDAEISIKYMQKIPGKTSFFELSAMINSLRSLVLNSRPLQAQDVAKPTEESKDDTSQWVLDPQRITLNKASLESIKTNAEALKTTISALTDADPLDIVQIINQVDGWTNSAISIMKDALAFGNPHAGLGTINDGKAGIFRSVMKRTNEIVERFEAKLVGYQDKVDEANLAVTEEEKIALLMLAEREIKTENTLPTPVTSAAYLTVLNTQKGLFTTKLNALKAIADTTTTSLATLYSSLTATLPLSDFDYEELNLEPIQNQIVLFSVDLASRLQSLVNDLTTRITKVDGFLTDHASATDSRKQVQTLENAGKAIFGDDYKMFHEFTMNADQTSEWQNAYAAKAQLLNYIQTTGNVDFPMDDWLYGLARVREKLHHWENITFLNEAFGKSELTLHPIQLPHKENDLWLALDYPEDYEINDDKLLYTAFYPAPFDPSKNQCGLLIDEWTELIPSKQETTGITFHYDRPNSEPPQVMLLAMPTDFRGEWQWSDLLDTINETLEMAKKRAIEPDQVDDSSYARFLPATVSSSTTIPLSPSLNYSFNNLIHEILLKNGN